MLLESIWAMHVEYWELVIAFIELARKAIWTNRMFKAKESAFQLHIIICSLLVYVFHFILAYRFNLIARYNNWILHFMRRLMRQHLKPRRIVTNPCQCITRFVCCWYLCFSFSCSYMWSVSMLHLNRHQINLKWCKPVFRCIFSLSRPIVRLYACTKRAT